MVYFLLNDLSLSGKMKKAVTRAKRHFVDSDIKYLRVTDIDYKSFFLTLTSEDQVVLFGGDGTLNFFVNAIDPSEITLPVYACKSGTGNDFLRDVMDERAPEGTLFQINRYFTSLPTVIIDGKTYRFFNNVSFGIDGEVCTVAEEEKRKGKKKSNYTLIAAKLLLKYKPVAATVIVDGVQYEFDHVWMAPGMNGRFFGGGMKPAPKQDRNSDKITLCVFNCTSRLFTTMLFPLIFKAWHVIAKKHFFMFEGKEITVRYHERRDIQIDGEVFRSQLEYTIKK